jgi:Inner membrane component of T3SS, cytoplasmic domain
VDTTAIVALVIVSVLLIVALIVLATRARQPHRAQCGGCRRAMMPEWTKCLFCGWEPSRPVPRLEFMVGPLAGQTVPLDQEVTTIGSVAGNTVVLSDPAVSRKHIGIRRVGERYELADLGSTNGVYVNGHRMAKKLLDPGDIMRVGNTEIVFRVQ